MSIKLTTVFLCAGVTLSGCARFEDIARDGILGADRPATTQECILVGRITAGCRDIVKPYNHKANPTLPPLEEQKKPASPGDEDCIPVNEVEVFCSKKSPLLG